MEGLSDGHFTDAEALDILRRTLIKRVVRRYSRVRTRSNTDSTGQGILKNYDVVAARVITDRERMFGDLENGGRDG